MNCFVLRPEEVVSSTRALVKNERARALRESIALDATELKIAILHGPRGRAKLERAESDEVALTLELEAAPLARDPTTLIVGISRPQTMKKVFQAATLLGAGSLHLVRSACGERSYLDARVLQPARIDDEIIEALEQGWDGVPPVVAIHQRFKPFVEDVVPTLGTRGTLRLLADATAHSSLGGVTLSSDAQDVMVAIGPEAGWSEFERKLFLQAGFQAISLGPRILRVETAVSAVLSQLQLLRAQCR